MKKKLELILVRIFNLKTLNFIGYLYGQLKGRKRSFSQYGEDLIVSNFFESIGLKNDGFYIDIGAYHPVFISNTHLLHTKGWSGLCVDLCDEKLKWFKYKRGSKVQTICAAISNGESDLKVPVFKHKRILSEIDTLNKQVALKNRTKLGYDFVEEELVSLNINDLLEKTNKEIDFLNIDIEGIDHLVLGSIDFNRFKPKVILFEDNEHFGGSTEIINMLLNNGYKHLFTSGGSVAFYLADTLEKKN
jgi:hypothetical protein